MPDKTAYHYIECGLPNIWITGLRTQDDAGEETIIIPGIRRLHKLIADQIVTSDGALTGAELRFLRSEMGMTQTQLGELVHRERLTVSRWESGKSAPDNVAEAFIRILAADKLRLHKVDPEEISGKCKPAIEYKSPIRINGTDPKHYRLVA